MLNLAFLKHNLRASSTIFKRLSSSLYKRSHLLGELDNKILQSEVTLCGWVSAIRNVSRNLFFLILRDHSGTVQLTLTRTHVSEDTFLKLQDAITKKTITPESLIAIKGTVQPRPIGQQNDSMSSGSIEVFVEDFKILNTVKERLPFTLNEKYLPDEEVRLQNRFLDLRRSDMQETIRFRSLINKTIRTFFDSKGFVEIETPILFKSSPEGAKEFLVSRDDGLKYALPQSPQQFKQLLMVGGFDKYYQIARCFRDEGMRSDRQPEFTQLDMEMAFVGQKEVMQIMEEAVKVIWSQSIYGKEIDSSKPFPRITYDYAMKFYGSDKPDLRFSGKIAFSIPSSTNTVIEGLLLKGRGRSSLNREESFEFCLPIEGIKSKSVLKAFEGKSDPENSSRSQWKWHGNRIQDCKMISDEERSEISKILESDLGLNVGPRDCLLVQKRKLTENCGLTDLGRARLAALEVLKSDDNYSHLFDTNSNSFLWVHSFPLLCPASPESLSQNPNRKFDSMHHPFTAPEIGIDNENDNLSQIFNHPEPLKLRAQHYDLVFNGQEIGGGSVRIHDSEIQERVFKELLGLSAEQVGHFDHLIRALKFGAPPHAGMALGLDRIVAILRGKKSIREVIAFPKTSTGQDLCFKSPN